MFDRDRDRDRDSQSGDLILAIAPNGAYKTKQDHPKLPVLDEELINLSLNAQKLGANMLHLHIRDEQGQHSIDATHYIRLLNQMNLVLPRPMVLQVTSEAANIFDVEAQTSMIKEVSPEFVSVAIREIIRAGKIQVQQIFNWMCDHGVNPQLIIYDQKDAKRYVEFLERGVWVGEKFPLLYVAGRDASLLKEKLNPMREIRSIVGDMAKSWMVCGFEALENEASLFALSEGGHIRIGFENNLYQADRSLALDNESQIVEVKKWVQESPRKLANYEKVVELLTPDWGGKK